MSTPLQTFIVAIDGGAASGKSSTARALSAEHNFLHVDTGSFYRFVTHELLERQIDAANTAALTAALKTLPLTTRISGRAALMEISGRVAGDEIRSAAVNAVVSTFAAVPALRDFLFEYQRSMAAEATRHGFAGLVMEGRDITTKIFPDAAVRIYLKTDLKIAQARRDKEGRQDNVAQRTEADMRRGVAPLMRADGAVEIDNSHLTLDEVVAQISALIHARLSKPSA